MRVLVIRFVILLLSLAVLPGCGKEVIHSKAGDLEFQTVEYLDRYPKDCLDVSPGCSRAVEGYEIVVVTFRKLKTEGPDTADPLGGMEIEDLGAVLRGPDGTEDKPFLFGGGPTEMFVGFTPKEGQPYHVLVWPGNEDLRLVRP